MDARRPHIDHARETPLSEAYAVLADSTSIIAAGINCSAPNDVMDAVRLATQATARPSVAYPNLGETWDSATHTWSGDAAFDTDLAADWVAAGARLVGGCCRVGTDQITRLAKRLVPASAPGSTPVQ